MYKIYKEYSTNETADVSLIKNKKAHVKGQMEVPCPGAQVGNRKKGEPRRELGGQWENRKERAREIHHKKKKKKKKKKEKRKDVRLTPPPPTSSRRLLAALWILALVCEPENRCIRWLILLA